jgi:hypothetical protein
MEISDFLTKIAKSPSSYTLGIPIPYFQYLIIFETVPVDIPNSLDICL